MAKEYKTTSEATAAIASGIRSYYAKTYPELSKTKAPAIEKAVTEVQKIYQRNFFPEMKVSWTTHANNIGHFYFPGCFRCHDGKHRSATGKVISKDCNLCHEVLEQKQENIKPGTKVSEFVHPIDIGDARKPPAAMNATNRRKCNTVGIQHSNPETKFVKYKNPPVSRSRGDFFVSTVLAK